MDVRTKKKLAREVEEHKMNTYGVAEKRLHKTLLRGILILSAHPQIRWSAWRLHSIPFVPSEAVSELIAPCRSIFHSFLFLS